MKDENKLLKAVYHDLEVASFLAGSRALGLVNKYVTGPLWRVLEKDDVSALDMGERYQKLLKFFNEWANDATPLLRGQSVVFDDVKVKADECCSKLTEANTTWDMMTKQALELICGSFVVVTKRMLSDHLEGGKYDKAGVELKEECKNTPKTNVVPERDFGMLDRLLAQKPNATTLVYEGIVMFTKNDTRSWRDSLGAEKKAAMMELARKSKLSQRQEYTERKAIIRKKREEKLEKGKEEKERRDLKTRMLKQELVHQVEEQGGLWKTDEEVDNYISRVKGQKEKKMAIRIQIQFRKTVLGSIHKDKKVFQMSSGGKPFSYEQMSNNLKEIIRQSNEDYNKSIDTLPVEDTTSGPRLVSSEKLLLEKERYKEKAKEEEIKAGKKRKGNFQVSEHHESGKRRKDKQVDDNLPMITVPEDLVGKRVTHHCFDDSGELKWFEGIVVSMHGKTGSRKPDFLIRYHGFESLYLFSYDDWKKGIVKLVDVTVDDFLGKRISQKFEDETHEHCWWEDGRVLNTVVNMDTNNPEFVVEFDCQNELDENTDDDISTECELCSFNLFEDYINNDLRLL